MQSQGPRGALMTGFSQEHWQRNGVNEVIRGGMWDNDNDAVESGEYTNRLKILEANGMAVCESTARMRFPARNILR